MLKVCYIIFLLNVYLILYIIIDLQNIDLFIKKKRDKKNNVYKEAEEEFNEESADSDSDY